MKAIIKINPKNIDQFLKKYGCKLIIPKEVIWIHMANIIGRRKNYFYLPKSFFDRLYIRHEILGLWYRLIPIQGRESCKRSSSLYGEIDISKENLVLLKLKFASGPISA